MHPRGRRRTGCTGSLQKGSQGLRRFQKSAITPTVFLGVARASGTVTRPRNERIARDAKETWHRGTESFGIPAPGRGAALLPFHAPWTRRTPVVPLTTLASKGGWSGNGHDRDGADACIASGFLASRPTARLPQNAVPDLIGGMAWDSGGTRSRAAATDKARGGIRPKPPHQGRSSDANPNASRVFPAPLQGGIDGLWCSDASHVGRQRNQPDPLGRA